MLGIQFEAIPVLLNEAMSHVETAKEALTFYDRAGMTEDKQILFDISRSERQTRL